MAAMLRLSGGPYRSLSWKSSWQAYVLQTFPVMPIGRDTPSEPTQSSSVCFQT